MRTGCGVLAIVLVAGWATSRAQVNSSAEISDPVARILQQKYLADLKAAAVDITAHRYPARFCLNRDLDALEPTEQPADAGSVRFANWQGQLVLQISGNYFAAYPDRLLDVNERVKRTYLDVIVPILRAVAPRLASEPKHTGVAIEISHHVRKEGASGAVENPEKLALVFPRAIAERAAASKDLVDQITWLRAAGVYVDGSPTSLWSTGSGH